MKDLSDRTIDLYSWHTPNGRKPAILLAELAVPYNPHLVDIMHGEQKRPSFLEINPNGKIPALVDRDPELGRVVVFESGAILQYLAEKYRRFVPMELGAARYEVFSWLYWQIGGPGPMFGQLGHFERDEELDMTAVNHFLEESKRLAGVLDRQLTGRSFVAGSYSIADIACYPWFDAVATKTPEVLDGMKEVRGWLKRVGARPAVREGMALEALAHAAE